MTDIAAPAPSPTRPKLAPDVRVVLSRWGALIALVALIAFNLAFTPNFADLADAQRQPHPGLRHRDRRRGMTLVIATGASTCRWARSWRSRAPGAAHLHGTLFPMPHPIVGRGARLRAAVLARGLRLVQRLARDALRIQPIVATLVLFIAGRGIAQVMTNGNLQVFKDPEFQSSAAAAVLGVPFQAVLMVVSWAAGRLDAAPTVFGRQILAVGGNERRRGSPGIPVAAGESAGST
jgi:ribose transport system permease protein